MDYSRLIEDGSYSKEQLSETDRAFVNGMEYALRSLEDFKNMVDFVDEESYTLALIKQEFAESIIEKTIDFLRIDINQTIVEAVDEEESRKTYKKNKQK